MIDITELKPNPDNPRTIKDKEFLKLKKKIKEFPEMLAKRPIVYDSTNDNIILGGNRRHDAVVALLKNNEIDVKPDYFVDAADWTAEQKRKFIVIDNISDGEWDYDKLTDQYEAPELEEWGLTVLLDTGKYTKKIETPIYEITGEKPELSQLCDVVKYQALLKEIDKSTASEDIKQFLRLAAGRHIVFDYGKIAEYYAQSDKDIQGLMENSALVIIDFQKAVENGFVELVGNLVQQWNNENEPE